MRDNQSSPDAVAIGSSRRALLKGAVGAGIGLAAWSAPKIGTIPAYAFTNSSGVFNGTCYYISYMSTGNGSSAQSWSLGTSSSPSSNQGQASSRDPATGNDAVVTFTWDGILPGGADLVVIATRTAFPTGSGTGAASISLAPGSPAGCRFEIPAASSSARATGDYTADIPAGTCSPSGTARAASYSLSGSQILLSGVVSASGQNHVIFNIVCD